MGTPLLGHGVGRGSDVPGDCATGVRGEVAAAFAGGGAVVVASGAVVGAGAAVDASAFFAPPEPGRAAATANCRTDALNVATENIVTIRP
jgi:hypothetical protein